MNRFYKVIAFLLAFVLLAGPVFAADPVVIEPYTKDTFPQWAKDLRRTEIITLGSLPFVTLTVTLVYSLASGSSSDLFSRTMSSSIDEKDQLIILGISGGISVVLGLVDLFINIHRRKKSQPIVQSGGITVTVEPLAGDPGFGAAVFDAIPAADAADTGESSPEAN
jgi:hypothetical protein